MFSARPTLLLAAALYLAPAISADEPAPTYRLRELHSQISEATTALEIQIDRTQGLDSPSSLEVRLEPAQRLTPDSPYTPAIPGVDYIDQPATVTFSFGQTTARVTLPLLNDRIEDGAKAFYIRLTGPNAPEFPSGPILVVDNELGYAIIHPDSGVTGEFHEGSQPYLILHRLGDYDVASAAFLTYYSSTAEPGRATANLDFFPGTSIVQFAPHQTEARVPLPIINDTLAEPTESFFARYSRKVTQESPEQSDELWILDNEFNPLPAGDFCLGIAAENILSLAPAGGGKVMILSRAALESAQLTLTRVDLSGAPDLTFTPRALAATGASLTAAPDRKFFLLHDHGFDQQQLVRLNADGTRDQSFAPFIEWRVENFKPAANGQILLVVTDWEWRTRLVRLNSNGTVDSSFQPPAIDDDDTSFFPSQDGRVYLEAPIQLNGQTVLSTIRLHANGSVDPTFQPPAAIHGSIVVNNLLYTTDSSRILTRCRENGARDFDFEPIRLGSYGALLTDENWFYIVSEDPRGLIVERFTLAGARDPSFPRGTIDQTASHLQLADGFLLMQGAWPHGFRTLNGRTMACSEFARVALQEGPVRIMLEPASSTFIESLPAQNLSVIRTGENHLSGGTIRYRVRDNTARAGHDFDMPLEGEIVFAPGESQKTLPFQIHNDRDLELIETFHLDFLNTQDALLSTSDVSILSEDIGLKIIRRVEGDLWELLPINNQAPYVRLYSTPDFQTRAVLGDRPSNQPIQIRFDGNGRFYYIE